MCYNHPQGGGPSYKQVWPAGLRKCIPPFFIYGKSPIFAVLHIPGQLCLRVEKFPVATHGGSKASEKNV